MAYEFYMNGILLPIAPSKLTMKINGKNKTMDLINDGEINLLNIPGLTDFSFTVLLPHTKYPFADYNGSFAFPGVESAFQSPKFYLEVFEWLAKSQKPFRFLVIRKKPNGEQLFDTNMSVSLEDYQTIEDAEQYGFDIAVDINLKQYKEYKTKEFEVYNDIQADGVINHVFVEVVHRPGEPYPIKNYTVQPGDSLYSIAKITMGDGEQWGLLYETNKQLIDSANVGYEDAQYTIHPGQVLVIPWL